MTDTYAIVESGGKQYRAQKGASLLVDRISAGEGEKVALKAVMFRGDGDDVVLAGDDLAKVKVEATVAEHLRGPKIRVFKYKAKKGYRRRQGHRSELTRLEVTDVKKLSRKPAAKKETEAKPSGEKKSEPKPKPAKPKSGAASKGKASGSGKSKAAAKGAASKKENA